MRCVKYGTRVLVTIISACAAGFIGTIAHRLGASSNVPIGLLLALLLVTMSAWSSRARLGVTGLGLHILFSTLALWLMSGYGPGGDAVIVFGFASSDMPWLSQHVGVLWIAGMLFVQVALLLVPRRWFIAPENQQSSKEKSSQPQSEA